jgi:pheromone shutdown-related protein TraB
MEVENLIIVSTSHVAKESVEKVRKTIENEKPDIVAVELDHKRLHALFGPQRRIPLSIIKRVGVKGFLFLVIGRWLQQRIGKWVGVVPGAEMKTAVVAAKKIKAKVALIDRDIEVTVKRLSAGLSWNEKLKFVKDLILGVLGKGRKMQGFELSKVPAAKLIVEVMAYLKENYPNVYRVLVEERNEVMAANIVKIMKIEPDSKIVAVVGAGHEEGIAEKVGKLRRRHDS